jgi:hypothetical protein
MRSSIQSEQPFIEWRGISAFGLLTFWEGRMSKLSKYGPWIGGIAFILFGFAIWFAPLIIAVACPSKPKPRTVESIQKQIAFCESKLEELQGQKELDSLLTESDKERMRSKGVSEEKIKEFEDKAKKSEELYRQGREVLIKEWEKKLEKLRQELEGLRAKEGRE